MKMYITLLALIPTLLALICLGAEPATHPVSTTQTKEKDPSMKRILVVYFSHSGNTREIAGQIHDIAGGDLFEIVPVDAYPTDYDEVVEQAAKEKDAAVRPKLKSKLEHPESYDVIFIGYPNWWNTFPMPVATFLTENNFSGKTLIPFCTHEGSGLGNSVRDLVKLAPDSKILEGLAVRGQRVKNARKDVAAWIAKLDLAKAQSSATQPATRNKR